MKTVLLAGFCWLLLPGADAGTISGIVRAQGKLPAQETAAGGAYDSKRYKFVVPTDYEALHDFVVYIDGSIAGSKPPGQKARVTQRDAAFIPHILPIMAGTEVDWPNEDTIFHNVFSKSPSKRFNLGLYKKGETPRTIVFDKPGEVDVFCSIHASMSCIILVLENPCFAATDARGHYAITNVPAGTYNLIGWQERLFSRTNVVTVPESGEIKSDFVLGPDGPEDK